MKLTVSVLLFFAAVGFFYAQAASLTSDTDKSASSEEEHTTVKAANYSELQKRDVTDRDTSEVDDDESLERQYDERSDLKTEGEQENTTIRGERAEHVTATMNVTTSKESVESDESTEDKDHDIARQKREHTEAYDYDDMDQLGSTE